MRTQLVGMFDESPADELRDSDLLQEKMRALLKRYFRKTMGTAADDSAGDLGNVTSQS